MKKSIYLALSAIFGILISLLVYIFLEIAIIYLIVNVFENYLKLSYDFFNSLRCVSLIILISLGFIAGLFFGNKWWKCIYIDKKYKGILFKIKR